MKNVYANIWGRMLNASMANSVSANGRTKGGHTARAATVMLASLAMMHNAAAQALPGAVQDGVNSPGVFVQSGTNYIISNTTVQNYSTKGGAGSGGGAGLGGAIFVNDGGSVVLNSVSFKGNTATGGQGGVGTSVGGSLNNIFNTGYTVGVNGASGANAVTPPASWSGSGNGSNGLSGLNGGSSGVAGTFGGNGGAGGAGSAGLDENSSLIADATLQGIKLVFAIKDSGAATAEAILAAAALAAAVASNVNVLAAPVPQALILTATINNVAAIARNVQAQIDAGLQAAATAAATTAVISWDAALSRGEIGIGGAGGLGGGGGIGGFAAGGGIGGQGGAGGKGGANWTGSTYSGGANGGTGGSGGRGGAGGFGAGGGSGGLAGDGGLPGVLNVPEMLAGQSGIGGVGGAAGFGAGVGTTQAGYNSTLIGGGGGSGFGGAIFVNKGGALTMTGNALFDQNNVVGGASDHGGTAGQAIGTDLFMMAGSAVVLNPGLGNTITFNGTIADNSSASIGATGVTAGQGANLTIASGLVVMNGSNTYTGQTILTGGALKTKDGVGINLNSNLNFAATHASGGVFQTNGLFNRFVGSDSNRVQWTGSGGFAATDGALTVSLNNNNKLTWGTGGFVANGNALVFGSTTATDAVTFTNAMDLSGGVGTILVTANQANNDTVTISGVISNGALIVGDAAHTGTAIFTAANTYAGGTTINGGNMVLSGNGSLNAAGAVIVNAGGTLDVSAVGNQTIGTLAGAGSTVLGAKTLTLTNASTNYAGVLSGTGGLTLTGGTQTLSGINTYTGATNVNSGSTLTLTGSLAGSNTVNVASTATLNNNNINGLATTATLTNAGTVNQNLNSTIASLVNSGAINGTGTLTAANYALNSGSVINAKLGTGAVTTTGNVTLNGTSSASSLNIASGTTVLGSASRLLSTPNVTVNGNLMLGGNEAVGQLIGTSIGNVNLSSGGLAVNAGNFAGVVSSVNATNGLTKVSNGDLVLSGTNTYTGLTAVNAGSLTLNGTLASKSVNVAVGATLNDNNVNGLAATATLTNGGTVNLAVNNTIATLVNSGTINGTGTLTAANYALNGGSVINANLGTGTLTTSNGTVTLVGTSAATTINVNTGSTLNLGSATTQLGGTLTNLIGLSPVLNVNGLLNLNNGSQTISRLNGTGTINQNSYKLNIANGGNFSGNILASNSDLSSTGGTLTLGNTTATTLTTTVSNGGTLAITSTGTGNTAVSTQNATISGGTMLVTATGAGSTAVTTQNATILNGGMLNVGSGGTFSALSSGGAGGGINVGSGSSIVLASGATLSYVMLNGGSASAAGGTITAAEFINSAGSSVGGFLTFTGNFTNTGTLSPGNSPGTTTILGNYNETATLQAQVQTTAAGGFDQIRVGGTVTLNPTSTLVVQPWGGTLPTSGNVYQIIADSAGGAKTVSGAFGNVLFDGNTSPNAAAVFDVGTGRLLTTGLNASDSVFGDLGVTPSQRAAANALMRAATSPVGVNQINSASIVGSSAYELLSANGATSSLNAARLVPEQYAGLANFGLLSSRLVSDLMFGRLQNMRKAGDDKSVYLGYLSSKGDQNNNNLNRNDFYLGTEAGNQELTVGGLFTSSTGSISSTFGGGTVKGQGTNIYARYAVNPALTILGGVGYSTQDFTLSRTSVTGTAQGITAAHGMNANFGATYLAYEKMDGENKFSISPRFSLNYAGTSVNGFTETGSSAQRLALDGYKANRTDLQIGVLFSTMTNFDGHAVKLALNVGVDSAINDRKGDMNASMVTASQVQFPISFASDKKTSGTLGLSASYGLSEASTLFFKHDYHSYSRSTRVELNIAF